MSNRPNPILAIALIALFASPVSVMAGPFGIFKRSNAKVCCCTAAAPVTAPIMIAASIDPEDTSLYSCRAYVYHSYMGGGIAESDLAENIPASQCVVTRALVLQQARDRIPPGAEEWYSYLDPDCQTSFARAATSPNVPLWEVTYKVWCCDKADPITVTLRDECLPLIKRAAKAFACHIANRDCCGIRCCQMHVRRINSAPCCQ